MPSYGTTATRVKISNAQESFCGSTGFSSEIARPGSPGNGNLKSFAQKKSLFSNAFSDRLREKTETKQGLSPGGFGDTARRESTNGDR
jgi:hypothetical protein